MSIAFIDLQAQRMRIQAELDAAIARVMESGKFILGPEVGELEERLSAFSGAQHAIACANGTDALALPLMAWGLRPGDVVFVPDFTFAATAEVVGWLGATPVFVDIDPDTYNMDPASLEAAIEWASETAGLRPRVVIAVDLFGLPADYPAIRALCDKHGLKLISDAAQGFGATLDGHQAIKWADVVSTSFYPAKPLGCYGDGGAIVTNDGELDGVLRSLRMHGSGSNQYDNVRIGMNSRLDTLQAAILIEKLKIFPDEIERRNVVAARYRDGLSGSNARPAPMPGNAVSTWAQYTVEHDDRDGLRTHLGEQGIPAVVYYPQPLHVQKAYSRFPVGPGGTPNTDAACGRVLSLPMHPYLEERDQQRIIDAVRSFNG